MSNWEPHVIPGMAVVTAFEKTSRLWTAILLFIQVIERIKLSKCSKQAECGNDRLSKNNFD